MASDINRVCVTGRLGADPELRKTQSGMSILSMRLAVNDRRKNQKSGEYEDYCNWIGVTVFGSRGESLSNLIGKGSQVGIDGKLRYSEWEHDGSRRSKIEIIADDVKLLGSKKNDQQAAEPEYVEATIYDDQIPF